MKLEDLHIGVPPLTDTIYMGTVSKRDRDAWASKVDCTSKFLGDFLYYLRRGHSIRNAWRLAQLTI